MFIIASAGNQGTEIEETTPASMMEALTVGAYNRQLKPCDFSNYTGGSLISVTSGATNHGELDGWAPGEEIWAAGLNGTYGYVAGTSIAAGITSAIAAGLLYWHSDEQGKKLRGFEDFAINSAITGSTNEIFRKGNLLDLSDPKYASCKNALATIISKHIVALNQAPDEFNMVFRAGEKTKNIRVLEPYFTLSYEMLDPLPNNFEILPDGRIYGTPTLEQGPSDGEEYKLYTCRFNRTNTQNETELVTVNMYVLASNAMPSSDLPEDHPINILAQAVCNSPPQSQCGVNYPQACSNACGFACCLPDFGKSATCTCY
jgi:hypothetical protein